jgi:hypothetical protein
MSVESGVPQDMQYRASECAYINEYITYDNLLAYAEDDSVKWSLSSARSDSISM